jgi:YebC/PmpR family DNA-binding regulatory protein
MAGHSKWANIKHRKAAQDAKRGKIFTKIGVEITVAARIGGGDPDGNPRLRAAVAKAKSAGMPKDNIDRAILKGTGGGDTSDWKERTYEGYGPSGVAFVVDCLTDNINRTAADIRHAFSKFGGSLGTDGSVSWQFHTKGQIVFEKSKIKNSEKLFEVAIENGAEDVKDESEAVEIVCEVNDFLTLKDAIDNLGIEPDVAEITRIPENYTEVDQEKSESIQKMTDWLEDNDDVQSVYHNAEFPTE